MHIDLLAYSDKTHAIIGAAIEVHRHLGPGLLESIYVECLRAELKNRSIRFEAERRVPVVYKGRTLDAFYRIDLIVEETVVVEVKSVAAMAAVFQAQVLTYLRLTHLPVALLINFNVPLLTDGVTRLVNPGAHAT
jgi:GxxExxY protein